MSLIEPEINSLEREPFNSQPLDSNEPLSEDFIKHQRTYSNLSEKLRYQQLRAGYEQQLNVVLQKQARNSSGDR